MSIIEAIILGIIQGLTEFLPVSSSGHLVLMGKIFGVEGDFVLFSVLMHVATLLAVLIYFHKDIWLLVKKPFGKDAIKLYIATVPTVLIVLLFKGFIENSFGGAILPFCFMFTAILLIVSQVLSKKAGKGITKTGAFCMGVAQGIAVLPGISRSGATICTGLIMGYDRQESAKFSFLMSVPIILASLLYELLGIFQGNAVQSVGVLQLILGFIMAFIVGLLSIKLMMKIVKNMKLYWFAVYLIIISIISFVILF